MILNKEQAKSIYDAMCTLNNVNGKIIVKIGDMVLCGICVFERPNGSEVRVNAVKQYGIVDFESYESQSAFASAYGLT